MAQVATPASPVTDSLRDQLIEELRERARKAESREQAERDRADRYERELADLHQRHDDLTIRLLPSPEAKPGLFRRWFG
ncbi:MAG: hypothetical protein HQL86_06915 [Magnetococcales bacterium]|nr:hypothetical protein [Magnetococcales bacterium]